MNLFAIDSKQNKKVRHLSKQTALCALYNILPIVKIREIVTKKRSKSNNKETNELKMTNVLSCIKKCLRSLFS